MGPKFSIIIPVYNVAPYLEACLRSVVDAAQEVERRGGGGQWKVEIVCVNDGSTDGSEEILEEYSRHSTPTPSNYAFKVLHQQNLGVSIARNVALEAATGDWIVACDPDDEVKPGWLVHIVEAIEANPEARFFWTGLTCVRGDSISVRDERAETDAEGLILEIVRGHLWGGMWSKVYHRETLNAYGIRCPQARVHSREDVVLCCDYLSRRPQVAYIPHADYIYKIRKGSLIHYGTLPTLEQDLIIEERLEEVAVRLARPDLLRELRLRLKYKFYDRFEVGNAQLRQLYPEITSCWSLPAPLHHKVFFWLSTHGFRSLVRMILPSKRR